MSGEAPRPGAIPGWGQQPAEPAESPPPAEPPPAPAAPPAERPPAPAGPEATPPATPWPAATPPPATPAPSTGWPNQAPPPTSPPPSTGWPTQAPPGAQPGWGQPAGPPSQPGAPGGWGQTPPGGPPGQWNPAPAAASSGCLKAFLILIVVAAIGLGVIGLALVFVGGRFVDQLGVGEENECAFLSREEARAVLGGDAEVLELTGLTEATLGMVLDTRVLGDAEDCWITSDASEAVGRVALYRGSDAAARFQTERENAEPRSEDRGGGISVETEGYFGGAVSGLGDEAFCTGVSPAIQAGVVARRGDTIVYASLSAIDGTTTDYETTPEGVVISPATCTRAQELARAMLP